MLNEKLPNYMCISSLYSKDKYACVCLCPEYVRKDIYTVGKWELLLARGILQAGAVGEEERDFSFSSIALYST